MAASEILHNNHSTFQRASGGMICRAGGGGSKFLVQPFRDPTVNGKNFQIQSSESARCDIF